jgi:hypothetical protein
MRIPLIALAAALLSQTAWGFPPPTGLPPYGSPHATTTTTTHNPCGAQQYGPRADLGRQVLVNSCNQLRAKLRASPDDADLRARCDHAAKALTGFSCEPAGRN